MYAVLEGNEVVTASADVMFPDRVEHLRIVEDEVATGEEGCYVFLWRTRREGHHEKAVLIKDTGSSGSTQHIDAYERWSIQWRGSLQACLRNFGEVHGDLVIEQATVARLGV
jgi:hypothetical protein